MDKSFKRIPEFGRKRADGETEKNSGGDGEDQKDRREDFGVPELGSFDRESAEEIRFVAESFVLKIDDEAGQNVEREREEESDC